MTPPLPQPVAGSASRTEGGRDRKSSAAAGPFVINLCSSTTPMALEQPKTADLKRFTFFVSRRREDGRERFRLHMGYFDTEAEAEEWLAVVRDIYPGAWVGEAPGKRLREREAAAQKAQSAPPIPQPPPHVLAGIAKVQSGSGKAKLAAPSAPGPRETTPPHRGESSQTLSFELDPAEALAPIVAPDPSSLIPSSIQLPAAVPDAARSALVAASASAQATARTAAPPPVLVVPTLQAAPPELPPMASVPVLNAQIPTVSVPVVAPAPAVPTAPVAANVNITVSPPAAASPNIPIPPARPPAVAAAPVASPAPARGAAPVAKPASAGAAASAPTAQPAAKVSSAPVAAKAAAKPAATRAPSAQPAAATPKAAGTDALSNVREVLAELDETGHTRQMPAPKAPQAAAAPVSGVAPSTSAPSMSDTQVLRFLENRRADGTSAPTSETDDGISLLKPDDTGTVRALKEAVTKNAPVSFAVQLQWSVQPIELSQVPPLAIFSAYTLYTVEGSREGRKWYGLRLGFFSDAISAKQVAYYVRSEFSSVAVVPVSPQERSRATDSGKSAAVAAARPPAPPKRSTLPPSDEIKLIDTVETPAPPVAAKPAPKPQARPPAPPAPKRAPKSSGNKVRARERRSPQSLEETLEILGADQLEIDNGRGELLNDTGVRHLKMSVQKNSPFSRLLVRLSERVGKG